jgi:hypothetical protein
MKQTNLRKYYSLIKEKNKPASGMQKGGPLPARP